VLSRLRRGDLRSLAVSGDSRWRLSPATPTIAESGYPSFSVMSWVGLAAPKGTPPAEVTRLNEAFRWAQQIPEIRQQVEDTGVDLYSLSPTETRELMQREVRQWRERVKTAGISVD
jgi:tripartite-type tricarboxylate transporter receptor subunit TctC